ncbi:MAG: LLM class F420-dependent oxidoreductase [Gammaproteobacteria bacterium]|nr:LLM class F420-dependent oxidoreductase [Gammaproteobacteria bacterium]
MTDFGLITFATDYAMQPAELGRWAEDAGFESLFYAEHTHIPTSRISPFGGGVELPRYYKECYDPFVALGAVASATEVLKLGTAICLVTEHNPITLAKTVATLDQISKGRVLLGIGAGWNAEEMADHGVEFKQRWKVARERVLAMRELWTHDEAEFHGDFVDFDSTWSWPKPFQKGGPPVLLGAASKWAPDRVVDYCDGWFPIGDPADLAPLIDAIREAAASKGRSMDDVQLTLGSPTIARRNPFPETSDIEAWIELGFSRIVLPLKPMDARMQRERLPEYVEYLKQFA